MSEGELRSGDVVEVRGAEEIAATLDADGRLEGLPFMAEMARLAGRRFVVSKRADKVCDTIGWGGSRKVPDAVFLEDLRCDGSAHGGCQAECRIYWKERWLKRLPPGTPTAAPAPASEPPPELLHRLDAGATATVSLEGKPTRVHRCQATEMVRASEALRTFDPRPYLRELQNGDWGLGAFARVMARAAWMQPLEKLGFLPKVHVPGSRIAGAPAEPRLGLAPGDWVRVKSREEIAATLTEKGKNRGLWFDREMLAFCGKTYQVRRRVERIVDEVTGRMLELRNDCITLDGVYCNGERSPSRWLCTRGIFSYWRECWLERVEPPRP
jgi:hypothetical protein